MISKKMRTLRQKEVKIDDDELPPYLPQELIIENVLTRVPAQTLAQWSCVCKLWYNSTYNDKRFADIHLLQSKKKLVFNLLNVPFKKRRACFFSLDDDYKHRLLMKILSPGTAELVGYCNGLACITTVHKKAYGGASVVIVVNPTRCESLTLSYLYPQAEVGYDYLCHGFGFDSSTQKYKIVIVFTSKSNDEFMFMAFTLGTNSWRKIVTSVADISPPPGSSPLPSRFVTRCTGNIRTPAVLCSGVLFWKVTNNVVVEEADGIINNNLDEVHINNKIDMLLSFDIHNEKLQFVRLPTECSLTPTLTTALVVEHHLLEHKGYPCVARSEKAIRTSIGHRHQHCSGQTSFVCRCRFTVQLYILKDKVKQVWIKGETLGLQVQQLGLSPASFCCYFDTTTATNTTLPTRILSFSDQLLLYWFDGECLKLYNLQTKHFETVRSSCSYNRQSYVTFETKMKGSPLDRGISDDDNFYCPYMDYQLHAQVENVCSLKTFIPAGEVIKFNHGDDYPRFLDLHKNNLPAGWVNTVRESAAYHAFF